VEVAEGGERAEQDPDVLRTSTNRRSRIAVVVLSFEVTFSQKVRLPVAVDGIAIVWYSVPLALS
jgi:hypothetical protein